jgi:hypothetical protein
MGRNGEAIKGVYDAFARGDVAEKAVAGVILVAERRLRGVRL